MDDDGGPPYIDKCHQKIYSLKPLRHECAVQISLFSFYDVQTKENILKVTTKSCGIWSHLSDCQQQVCKEHLWSYCTSDWISWCPPSWCVCLGDLLKFVVQYSIQNGTPWCIGKTSNTSRRKWTWNFSCTLTHFSYLLMILKTLMNLLSSLKTMPAKLHWVAILMKTRCKRTHCLMSKYTMFSTSILKYQSIFLCLLCFLQLPH